MHRTRLADGLRFPEGPVLLGPSDVAFVEIRGGCVSRWDGTRVTAVAITGRGPNGATLGPDGALYVTNNGGVSRGHDGVWLAKDLGEGSIQRVTLAGDVRVVAGDLPGAPPHRPNDCCFGPDGRLYFTDPHNWEDDLATELRDGRVCRTTLDGAVELLCEVPRFPNGIAFGPDGRLYVAQSITRSILVMEPTPGATPEVWCRLPSGYPDGFCFDRDGCLYAAGSLGDVLVVFEPDGRVREVVDMGAGSEPTNCAIGDGRLYVTCAGIGTLEALDVGVEALPLHPRR